MLLLLCFFAFLHCWLNLFGELLQFADRMFYKVRGVQYTLGQDKNPLLLFWPGLYSGLVELHVLHQLLPHLERGGARLAVLLRLPGLSLGKNSNSGGTGLSSQRRRSCKPPLTPGL